MSDRRSICCLTPVKNEDWIIELFLRCALRHCKDVIVADQQSTDRTWEIASRFENVTVIENKDPEFSEEKRQNLLITEARKQGDGQILLALDADEVISANVSDSAEWDEALQMPPGTVFEFPRIELYNSHKEYFRNSADSEMYFAFGYIDDGKATKDHSFIAIAFPPRMVLQSTGFQRSL